MITSSLTYGAHVWSLNFLKLIKKLYISCFKKLFRIPNNTPPYAVRIETSIFSIRYIIIKFIINWLIKTLGADDYQYPKLCLLRLIDLSRLFPNDQHSWFNQIKNFFTSINREDIWLDIDRLQINRNVLLRDYRLYSFNEDIENCKSSSCVKIYPNLDLPDISKPVLYICNFRYLHQLRIIAQLRFANIYYNAFLFGDNFYKFTLSDLCIYCDLMQIDDVCHTLCFCPKLSDTRDSFYNVNVLSDNDENSLSWAHVLKVILQFT